MTNSRPRKSIATWSSAYKNGGAVRLSDVATVVEGPENSELAAWANRTPAIILNIQRQPGTNVIAVVDAVKAVLPKLEQTLPAARRREDRCPIRPPRSAPR